MLNFAEQTGSGAVIVVWSFLLKKVSSKYRISDFVVVTLADKELEYQVL